MEAPPPDCPDCPRLIAYRQANCARFATWHNAPVPSFGDLGARLLVVGLAPGLKGANRTGRPFTGDHAGDLLYATLLKFGFARGTYQASATDGLALLDCRITNAVRCVPPENKPTGAEKKACRPFLGAEIAGMARLRVILALGTVAHAQVLSAMGQKISAYKFAHGAIHHPDLGSDPSQGTGQGPAIVNSYHCSRLNTNTGRLTTAMFEEVFAEITNELG